MIDRIRSLFAKIFPRVGVPAAAGQFFLWDGIAPGSENQHGNEKINFMGKYRLVSNIHRPSITAFIPAKEKATGVAIIIAPGGGHKDIWIEHEGYAPAQWFCEHGIACFVLKYRLSKDVSSIYSVSEHALKDIQRAIRFVRSKSDSWGIEKNKIGVMGFSAGGELAGLAAINFDDGKENASDDIDKQSCYPDFQALIYPSDTRNFPVSKKSPPLFLLAGSLDSEIANDISKLYAKYQQAGSPAVLHIYENVDHGFGVQKSNKGKLADWPMQFYEWLSASGFIQ
ncbi:MAG: alpha/beta hydrolase [Bacteroidetes bacterium]|nr:alpha/beta hydrolase [Bacteroidota bacterium]